MAFVLAFASSLPTAPFLLVLLAATLLFMAFRGELFALPTLFTLCSRLSPLLMRRTPLLRNSLYRCLSLPVFLTLRMSRIGPLLPYRLGGRRRPLLNLLQVLTHHLVARLVAVLLTVKPVLLLNGPRIPVAYILALVGG